MKKPINIEERRKKLQEYARKCLIEGHRQALETPKGVKIIVGQVEGKDKVLEPTYEGRFEFYDLSGELNYKAFQSVKRDMEGAPKWLRDFIVGLALNLTWKMK